MCTTRIYGYHSQNIGCFDAKSFTLRNYEQRGEITEEIRTISPTIFFIKIKNLYLNFQNNKMCHFLLHILKNNKTCYITERHWFQILFSKSGVKLNSYYECILGENREVLNNPTRAFHRSGKIRRLSSIVIIPKEIPWSFTISNDLFKHSFKKNDYIIIL